MTLDGRLIFSPNVMSLSRTSIYYYVRTCVFLRFNYIIVKIMYMHGCAHMDVLYIYSMEHCYTLQTYVHNIKMREVTGSLIL